MITRKFQTQRSDGSTGPTIKLRGLDSLSSKQIRDAITNSDIPGFKDIRELMEEHDLSFTANSECVDERIETVHQEETLQDLRRYRQGRAESKAEIHNRLQLRHKVLTLPSHKKMRGRQRLERADELVKLEKRIREVNI